MSGFIPFGSLIDKIRNKDDDDFEGTYDSTTMDDDSDSTREGMYLIVMTCVFLFLLVLLRYGCIWFIDVVILCEHRRNRRTKLGRLLSTCCPRWFPPMSSDENPDGQAGDAGDDPAATNNANSDNSDVEDGTELVERNINSNYAKRLLRHLAEDQKRDLFAYMLDHRTVTEADFRNFAEPHGGGCCDATTETDTAATAVVTSEYSSIAVPTGGPAHSSFPDSSNADSGISCPICITDIRVGERIYHCKTCNHLFKLDCILEWLVTGSTLCPYCRREIFTRKMLEEAFRKQQLQQQPKKEAA